MQQQKLVTLARDTPRKEFKCYCLVASDSQRDKLVQGFTYLLAKLAEY